MPDKNKLERGNASNSTALLAPFRVLALGTRFKHVEGETIWVKISSGGTIAKWEHENRCTGWSGQSICCLNDDDNMDEVVRVIS